MLRVAIIETLALSCGYKYANLWRRLWSDFLFNLLIRVPCDILHALPLDSRSITQDFQRGSLLSFKEVQTTQSHSSAEHQSPQCQTCKCSGLSYEPRQNRSR